MTPDRLLQHIPTVADFPSPGIAFRDIVPLLAHPEARQAALLGLVGLVEAVATEESIAGLCAIESRGFVFAAPLADRLGLPLMLMRKPGKLPPPVAQIAYDLEYGSDALECRPDLLPTGSRVVVVDDVLATGGTLCAASDLLRRTGLHVAGAITLLEIEALNGAARLATAGVAHRTLLRT